MVIAVPSGSCRNLAATSGTVGDDAIVELEATKSLAGLGSEVPPRVIETNCDAAAGRKADELIRSFVGAIKAEGGLMKTGRLSISLPVFAGGGGEGWCLPTDEAEDGMPADEPTDHLAGTAADRKKQRRIIGKQKSMMYPLPNVQVKRKADEQRPMPTHTSKHDTVHPCERDADTSQHDTVHPCGIRKKSRPTVDATKSLGDSTGEKSMQGSGIGIAQVTTANHFGSVGSGGIPSESVHGSQTGRDGSGGIPSGSVHGHPTHRIDRRRPNASERSSGQGEAQSQNPTTIPAWLQPDEPLDREADDYFGDNREASESEESASTVNEQIPMPSHTSKHDTVHPCENDTDTSQHDTVHPCDTLLRPMPTQATQHDTVHPCGIRKNSRPTAEATKSLGNHIGQKSMRKSELDLKVTESLVDRASKSEESASTVRYPQFSGQVKKESRQAG